MNAKYSNLKHYSIEFECQVQLC